MERRQRFAIGSIEVRLNVSEGEIKEAKIFGDFFGLGEIKDVEEQLVGTKYEKAALEKVVDQIDVTHYFGNITKEEFLSLIY